MEKKKRSRAQVQQHHQPFLAEEPTIARKRSRAPKKHQEEEKLISSVISSKIVKEALLQQKEIDDEDKKDDPFSTIVQDPNKDSDESEDDFDGVDGFSETQSQYNGDYQEEEVDEDEERLLEAFMSKESGPQLTLADLIINKIREKDEEVSTEARPLPKLDNTIIDLYKGIGRLLHKYTTGKLPKAFKYIPSTSHWEELLYLTEPEKWSANAVYQATRVFCSNMPAKKVQRFYSLVLLPRVRDDIQKNKRLHFSLYQALKKSMYKPQAFNKGLLFPLCESGTCTLREAVILGSIISKVSIPPLHAGVALMILAEMDYCGTTSYFIKLLLDKGHALPYRVVDALVAHFMRFFDDKRTMPVIWHQSLLAFVQRYKHELTREDKDNLQHLLQIQKHHLVTPEIKRELKDSRNRGEKEDPMAITAPISAIVEDRFDIPDVPMEDD